MPQTEIALWRDEITLNTTAVRMSGFRNKFVFCWVCNWIFYNTDTAVATMQMIRGIVTFSRHGLFPNNLFLVRIYTDIVYHVWKSPIECGGAVENSSLFLFARPRSSIAEFPQANAWILYQNGSGLLPASPSSLVFIIILASYSVFWWRHNQVSVVMETEQCTEYRQHLDLKARK
jgi:hypothetical protein